ncbi:RB1CC1 family protein [Megaselia abdita]
MTSGESSSSSVTLLQWITAKQNPQILNSMADECSASLNAFSEENFEALKSSFNNIIKSAKNDDYKEIKGLETRLMHLQKLFETLKTKVQDQKDLSASFQMNKSFGSTTGDSSILEDLCASHRNQLGVMLKNYLEIREIRIKIFKSKQELCDNLYERLKYIVKVENSMSDSDNTHLFYYRVLSRSEKHLEVMEQINKTPFLYLAASTEVQRRSLYSDLFLKWCAKISKDLETLNSAEINRRKLFNAMFENHFLVNLFPGMEDVPPRFTPEIPIKLDCNLPKITQSDINLLTSLIPNTSVEIIEPFNLEYLKQFFDIRKWNIIEKSDIEGNIFNTCDPVGISETSENQLPIVEESTWENNEMIENEVVEPEKVKVDNQIPPVSIESTIEKSIQKSDNPHVGTTLKNLNFRSELRQSSEIESTSKPSQKSAVIENCRKGDIVICYWNNDHQQYGIIQDSTCLYFVHGDSLNDLKLKIPPCDNSVPFIFGVVTDKEYCQAKKDENRYKVERGTKFYRVKLSPLSRRSSLSRKDQDDNVSTTSDSRFLEISNRRRDLMAKLSNNSNLLLDESQMIISATSIEATPNLSHSIGLFTLIEPVLSSIRNMDLE